MAKRKKKQSHKQDIIEQGLISSKSLAAFLRLTTRDKRTKKSTQRAAREVFSGRRTSDVAEDLGISTQRATSLKKQVEQGKAYSPELRDILQGVRDEYISTPQLLNNELYLFHDERELKRQSKHIDRIKSFSHLEDALEWWKAIINSDTFIAILQTVAPNGKPFYHIVGLGERSQRPRNKKIEKRGNNRVAQIIAKHKKNK